MVTCFFGGFHRIFENCANTKKQESESKVYFEIYRAIDHVKKNSDYPKNKRTRATKQIQVPGSTCAATSCAAA